MTRTAKWCLTCGKDPFRCLCKVTQLAHDEAPVEPVERPAVREPAVAPKMPYGRNYRNAR